MKVRAAFTARVHLAVVPLGEVPAAKETRIEGRRFVAIELEARLLPLAADHQAPERGSLGKAQEADDLVIEDGPGMKMQIGAELVLPVAGPNPARQRRMAGWDAIAGAATAITRAGRCCFGIREFELQRYLARRVFETNSRYGRRLPSRHERDGRRGWCFV